MNKGPPKSNHPLSTTIEQKNAFVVVVVETKVQDKSFGLFEKGGSFQRLNYNVHSKFVLFDVTVVEREAALWRPLV